MPRRARSVGSSYSNSTSSSGRSFSTSATRRRVRSRDRRLERRDPSRERSRSRSRSRERTKPVVAPPIVVIEPRVRPRRRPRSPSHSRSSSAPQRRTKRTSNIKRADPAKPKRRRSSSHHSSDSISKPKNKSKRKRAPSSSSSSSHGEVVEVVEIKEPKPRKTKTKIILATTPPSNHKHAAVRSRSRSHHRLRVQRLVLPALVLDIAFNVKNDENLDGFGLGVHSGLFWGLNAYHRQLQVWQIPNGTFVAIVRDSGTWQTFAGALSPNVGVKQTRDVSGTFEGGEYATFAGTFAPGARRRRGFIGTFDYGGTRADVVLPSGQVGDKTPFHFLDAYFSGVSGFSILSAGWDFEYKSQTYHNFIGVVSGDIVV